MIRGMLVLYLLTALAATAAEVPVVHCPTEAPTVRTFDLVERWRIDADDPDAPLMGLVRRVRDAGPGGDLYLLDQQLCQVLVFSPDGEYLQTLGREGDGPGEFRRPTDLRILADGTLAVRDGWPTRMISLDAGGEPAGTWSPDGNWSLHHCRRVDHGWIASGMKQGENDGSTWNYDEALARWDDDGQQVHSYRACQSTRVFRPHTYDETRPYFAGGRWDLTADDLLVLSAARDEYRLEYLDLDGNLVRTVERDFAPYRRTGEDKAEIRDGQRVYMNGERQEIVFHLVDTEPAISWLRARDDGTLMVGTCFSTRDLPDGVVMRFDVHGADGALLEEVRIAGDCDLEYDLLQVLSGNQAVVLRNYDSTARTMYSTGEEGDPVREDDDVFAVIVCDLVER